MAKIRKPIKISNDLINVFSPFVFYCKVFGAMTFTIKKSSKTGKLISKISKIDIFLILMRIFVPFYIMFFTINDVLQKSLKGAMIIFIIGIRGAVCCGLLYNTICTIMEIFFRKKMLKVMNEMINFDNDVSEFL